MKSDEKAGAVSGLNDALRLWYASFNDLGRQFGFHLRMHSTDAAALLEITNAETRDAPLTPTQLAHRVGLSTTATSTLLSRLEGAGHVERIRDQKDRRVVTLRSTPQVHEEVQRFFQDVGDDLDQVATEYSAEELQSMTEMLASMTRQLDRHLGLMAGRRLSK
jgi:DNA-binding MarR family transcriptional regulator